LNPFLRIAFNRLEQAAGKGRKAAFPSRGDPGNGGPIQISAAGTESARLLADGFHMQFSRRSKRYLFPAAALIAATLVAAICVFGFQAKVASFQPLGASAEAAGGGWRIKAVEDAGTGLAAGDFLLTVNGAQAESAAHLGRLLRGHPTSELLVQRGDQLLPVAYQRPALEIDYAYLVLTLIGLGYFLIGLFTTIKDREGKSRLFYFWCLVSATLYVASPIYTGDAADRAIYLVDLLARLLLPGLTAHLFLVFPERLLAGARARLLPLLYAPGAALLAFHLDSMFLAGRVFGPASAAQLRLADRLELLLLVAAGLFAAAISIFRYRRTQAWEPRQQTGWVLAGLAASYLPFLFFYLLPFSAGLAPPTWARLAATLPLAALPLAFAWAILKYRLLDLGSILRNIAATTVTAIAGIFAFQLIQLAIERGVGQEMSMARNVLTFAAGLLVAGVLAPTRKAVSAGLERFQFRGHLGPRRLVASLGAELLHERSLDQLCETLVEHLSEALDSRVELYLMHGRGLSPARPRPELPAALPAEVFSEDFWEREVEPISLPALPQAAGPLGQAERRLFAAGFRYAFPIKVRGRRLGLVLIGYKLAEEPLSGEDLDLVAGLLSQAALAIENAQLLDEVQQRLEQVSRLESYNKGILESSPAGLAVLGAGNLVVLANHAFAAVVGRERQQCLGAPLESLLPVRPLPEPQDGLVDVSYCEASGAERHLQLSSALYQAEDLGGEQQRVLIVIDRSEQVLLEQALQEREHMASLGMLAAGVAHEVNTPLTGISSYAQFLIADTPEDDPRFAILKKMERQTFRAAEIVGNLLDFARNRRSDALSRLRLDSLCTETLGLLEVRAREAGVALELVAPQEPVLVRGNEGELHQVLTNLVVNAINAQDGQSEPGRVEVRLEQLDHRVRLKVSDNGPGIPPERLQSIFKPFFSSRIGRGGTGLGLAISHNIVRRHGGEIAVQNNFGQNRVDGRRGCTFTVELPAFEQPVH
jgi:two-component system NtrC family sensor kinase